MTPDEWWRRSNEKRVSAELLLSGRKSARDCYHLVGTSIEFALKATIARKRFNSWPTRAERPDLYTHDLRLLFSALGVDHTSLPPGLRAKLRTVLSWSRDKEYVGSKMPRKEAVQIFEAAFNEDGVIAWLKTL